MSQAPQRSDRRVKDSARLQWDTKPRRAPNPKDIEFQTAEIVVANPEIASGQIGLSSRLDGGGDPQNRLIWGDCLLACQALLSEGYEGRINLIYIDPPFKSDEDYSHLVRINGHETATKAPSMLERLAYRDMWIGGIDSYLDMLYPRLQLMRRLLAPHGSLYLHIGTDVSAYIRVLLDEVFGRDRFESEIIWKRTSAHSTANRYGPVHDVIYFYSRSDTKVWQPQPQPYSPEYLKAKYASADADGRHFRVSDITGAGLRSGETGKPWRGFDPNGLGRHWTRGPEELEKMDAAGLIYWPKNNGWPGVKRYLEGGLPLQDIWTDISPVNSQAKEDTGFDTQKPEELVKRIIETSSKPGDLVADFFLGSGTTAVVAEKLGRHWIGVDFGKTGIQVSRSRLVEAQASPFVLQNIGNYQRQMIYLTGSRIGEVQRVILKLYDAEPRSDEIGLGVRRADDGSLQLVYVGYPDRQISARKAEELLQLADRLDGQGYHSLVILGWDYDLNFDADLEGRLALAKPPYRARLERRSIPPYIYDYLKQMRDESEIEALRPKIHFAEKRPRPSAWCT